MAIKKIAPDNEAAITFLEKVYPDGPWCLTAIQTDRKAIETRTFGPTTRPATLEWISKYNGNRNIYWHVNPVIGNLKKKAERQDIKALNWLHVDVDPRAGEDIDEERERALNLLTKKLPEGIPPPTWIIFSGGGYQAGWKLTDPLKIEGDVEKAEEAKLYNLQLELIFGADNCHNVDRILRLPGTINLPDARKLKKGRVAALAKVVSFENIEYTLETFAKATTVQEHSASGFGGPKTVEISGNVERVMDLNELDEWSVPDRVKIIIAQGLHPDEPKEGDNSRSAWLFDVCCNLARCKVPDETIYSIITDPDWEIAASVLEMKSNAHKYAVRQIEKAREYAIDPELERLNSRFAIIETLGGKCRVVEEVVDEALNRPRLTLQSFEDFRNRFMHLNVKVGEDKNGIPIYMPLGKWWLLNSNRRQYRTVVFTPGREIPEVYNMWKGFGCESRPGDCSLFLSHIRNNVCNRDKEHYDYLMGWMARLIQYPATPGEVAVVLRGGRGTGKSFFAVWLGKLLGRHFLHVSNSSHLTGNFNSHLRDLVLLFADEAFFAGDKKHASILKTLITEATLTIERKGVDVETAPNYIHLIMASNDMHVIPAGGDERRFFVVDVGQEQQQNSAYFKAIADQLDDGGLEALLHHLMTYDLSEYEVRNVPKTTALHEQKLLSLDPDQEWWYQKLVDGDILRDQEGWPAEVVKDTLVDDYVEHTKRFNVQRRGNQTALGRFLNRMCPKMNQVRRTVKVEVMSGDGYTQLVTKRLMHLMMPTLAQARERWERLNGPEDWPDHNQGELLEKDETNDPPF